MLVEKVNLQTKQPVSGGITVILLAWELSLQKLGSPWEKAACYHQGNGESQTTELRPFTFRGKSPG